MSCIPRPLCGRAPRIAGFREALSFRQFPATENHIRSSLYESIRRPRLIHVALPPGARISSPRKGSKTMWTKQQAQTRRTTSAPSQAAKPAVVAFSNPATSGAISAAPCGFARYWCSLPNQGDTSPALKICRSMEKVDGPISCAARTPTSGRGATTSEIHAAKWSYTERWSAMAPRDRVDVKSDGSVVGRQFHGAHRIETGAQFKGRTRSTPPNYNAAAD